MLYDERNKAEIEKLHPVVKEKVSRILQKAEEQGLEVLVTDGFRTAEEQESLYAIGRTKQVNKPVVTKARAGQSFHNYGLAIDIVPVNPDRSTNYGDYDTYKKFAVLAKAEGFTWGDEWKIKDTPHFEYTEGKPVSYFQKGGEIAIFPEWAKDIVAHCQKKGITTDLNSKVGDLPLYHLLAILKKADIEQL